MFSAQASTFIFRTIEFRNPFGPRGCRIPGCASGPPSRNGNLLGRLLFGEEVVHGMVGHTGKGTHRAEEKRSDNPCHPAALHHLLPNVYPTMPIIVEFFSPTHRPPKSPSHPRRHPGIPKTRNPGQISRHVGGSAEKSTSILFGSVQPSQECPFPNPGDGQKKNSPFSRIL